MDLSSELRVHRDAARTAMGYQHCHLFAVSAQIPMATTFVQFGLLRAITRPVNAARVAAITRPAFAALMRHHGLKAEIFLPPSRLAQSSHILPPHHARVVQAWVSPISLNRPPTARTDSGGQGRPGQSEDRQRGRHADPPQPRKGGEYREAPRCRSRRRDRGIRTG